MYPTQSKRYNIGVQGKRLVVRRNVIRERNGDATRGRGLRTNFLDRVAVVGGGAERVEGEGRGKMDVPATEALVVIPPLSGKFCCQELSRNRDGKVAL